MLLLAALGVPPAPSPASTLLTLDDAFAAALTWHERLVSAAAERERSAVTGWRALSALGPTITEVGSVTREKDEIAFPAGAAPPGDFNPVILQKKAVRGTLSVTQPLYTHQFWPLRELGRIDDQRGDEVMRAARQDVLLTVADAYYDALRARALAAVAEETRALAAVEIAHARERVAAGEAVRSDIVRAETEAARAAELVAETQGGVEIADQRLVRLTGVSLPLELSEPPTRGLEFTTAEPFVATALQRSPELRLGDLALTAARQEERRRRAALYPTLGFQFHYRLVDEPSLAERNDFWDVTAAVEVPLLDAGGARLLDLAEQRARVAQADAARIGVRREIELAARQAFVEARTLGAREAAAGDEERLAIESHRLLSQQYAAGVATSLDALAALTARHAARANLAAVRYARAQALVRLERVTGILGEEGARGPIEAHP
jgi:outer membrane protein